MRDLWQPRLSCLTIVMQLRDVAIFVVTSTKANRYIFSFCFAYFRQHLTHLNET